MLKYNILTSLTSHIVVQLQLYIIIGRVVDKISFLKQLGSNFISEVISFQLQFNHCILYPESVHAVSTGLFCVGIWFIYFFMDSK